MMPPFVRRCLWMVLGPAFKVGLRIMARHQLLGDPWDRFPRQVPPALFGEGSRHNFDWYFEGTCSVRTRSLDEVCDWLLECEYASDPDLFHEADVWQHPRTFERLRQGDCEDHALWAWRQLVEQNVDAEFITGLWHVTEPDPVGHGHAGVLVRQNEHEYLLETVAKERARMLRPLSEASREYRPHVSINSRFETHFFCGNLHNWNEQLHGVQHAPLPTMNSTN